MELRWCQHACECEYVGRGVLWHFKEFLPQCYCENISTLPFYCGLVNIFAKQRPVVRGLVDVSRGEQFWILSVQHNKLAESHIRCQIFPAVLVGCCFFLRFNCISGHLFVSSLLKPPSILMCILLDCWRKPEGEPTHRTESPRVCTGTQIPFFYYLPSN